MNIEKQPILFEAWDTSKGALELFPAVWSAAQELAHPDPEVRLSALHRLAEMGAPRLSPLVAYLIATRLMDPNVQIRKQVVRVIGELVDLDKDGRAADSMVRQYVQAYLSQMRTRMVYSLLQVAEQDPDIDPIIARMLNMCPYAGEHLADIFTDRKNPLSVRKKAIFFVGLVGYLDAAPDLERLETRLEARLNGQQAMPFAPLGSSEEAELLPLIHQVLALLRAP